MSKSVNSVDRGNKSKSNTSILILPGRMTVVGKKYIVAIYYRHPARQVNGSIYIQTKLSQTTNLIMP